MEKLRKKKGKLEIQQMEWVDDNNLSSLSPNEPHVDHFSYLLLFSTTLLEVAFQQSYMEALDFPLYSWPS